VPTRNDPRPVYRIIVQDELDNSHAAAFAGLKVEPSEGQTAITGPIRDQAELHGILSLVSALHLTLLSLNTIDNP
jgi:hypothetical protein